MTDWVVVNKDPKLPGKCMVCGIMVDKGPYALKNGIWDAIWHLQCALSGTIESHDEPRPVSIPVPAPERAAGAFGEEYVTLMDVFSILSDTLKETNLCLKAVEQAIRRQGP